MAKPSREGEGKKTFPESEVILSFEFPGVDYDKEKRALIQRELNLKILLKVWYEIVRTQTEATQNWRYHELYLGISPDGYELPVHRGHGEGWPDLLKQARKHLADNDERAAAVYARAAFERKLQKYCEDKNVPVIYRLDPRSVTAESLWKAIKKNLETKGQDRTHQAIINRIETYRKIVLNPLSHATPTTVTRPEIQGAIEAVEALSL